MANVSYSLGIDAKSMAPEAITVGTLAPNAGDVELRISTTNAPTRKQVILILEAFRRRLAGQYGTSDVLNI
jgi:hypothetical protein